MKTKSISDEINEKTNNKGYTISQFGGIPYKDLEEMFNILEQKHL